MEKRYTFVEQELCIACKACGTNAPKVYKYDDEGIAYVTLDNNMGLKKVPQDFIKSVEKAYEGCPTDAIQLSNIPFNMD
ncbi:ferredoxin [Neobacillus sp. OS1-33]|jgi:ferredoxin|uniref:ferredoxin n=1 Tax=Neobacillus sp. OS1-33 TaxID=3070683 RepID=UPI0027DEF5D9|nr:ferredoxin [Neobacillus sp. OS1-33]WML27357.1 ferredoxin [Neobacillus sp. OS1-33]